MSKTTATTSSTYPDPFTFTDYKKYLVERLAIRGERARFSRAIGCQTAYISQVLSVDSGRFAAGQLSVEQAEAANQYFKHDDDESDFFLILVSIARAGSAGLKKRLERQREGRVSQRLLLRNRVKSAKQLSLDSQSKYYGSWVYGAVHALASIPRFQNDLALAEKLKLDLGEVRKVLDFMLNAGVLAGTRSACSVSNTTIHLPSDSPLISRHHSNWRIRAIQNLASDAIASSDLHYSSVISISDVDAVLLRELLLKTILKFKETVRKSKEETARVFNVDFFEI